MARNKRQRWYGAQGQKHIHMSALEKSSGLRRLFSLVVLLVMVLILIQQTSDVKKVGKVAAAIGLLPNPNLPMAVRVHSDSDMNALRSPQGDATASQTSLEQVALKSGESRVRLYQQIWNELLKRAPEPVVGLLAHKIFGQSTALRQDSQSKPVDIPSKERWQQVQDWFAEAKTQVEQWLEIERVNQTSIGTVDFSKLFLDNSAWFGAPSQNEPTPDNEFFRGLLLALDQRLLNQVIDNSAWLSVDRIPFARTWQRIKVFQQLFENQSVRLTHIAETEVAQLMTGGQTYRGKPMRFGGTIFRVDQSTTFSQADFGVNKYLSIWIKPDNNSNQPVCVYAPAETIDANVILEKDTHVALAGYFFKRIAYASQRGSEIAPLILAAAVLPFDSASRGSAFPNPFIALDSGNSDIQRWQPPVDTATPYSLVSTSLERVLESMQLSPIVTGALGSDVAQSLKPILELERLAPEVGLLLKNQSEWPISKSISLSRVSGLVTKLERLPIDTRLPQLQEWKHAYRCRIESGTNTTIVLSSSVPSGWLRSDGSPLDSIRQPCSLDALKVTESNGNAIAWTRSFQWVTHSPKPGVAEFELSPILSRHRRFLLDHDWDLSWIDLVREQESEQIHAFSTRELEPYYSLMALANRATYLTDKTDLDSASKPLTIPELMETFRQKPKGKVPAIERVIMNMRVVRISRIAVERPEDAAVLGGDHYFQLDVMADIGNRTYEMKGDKGPIVYHREYPVTCVTLELPSWLSNPAKDSSSGANQVWYPGVKSSSEGWFYRFWTYKTEETNQTKGDVRKQIGPLIVLDQMQQGYRTVDGTQSISEKTVSTITTVIGVIGAVGIWWFVRKGTKRKRN